MIFDGLSSGLLFVVFPLDEICGVFAYVAGFLDIFEIFGNSREFQEKLQIKINEIFARKCWNFDEIDKVMKEV